jgi:threonine/homoserine/homoserine lactone efflux protein
VVPAGQLLAFAALAAVLIAVPGPSVLFTIGRALTVGRRAALFTVAGNELGLCVQVAAVAFGVGAVVERSAEIFTIVKWAGAAYLAYLGVQAIRHRKSVAGALAARITPVQPLRAMRDGFLVGVTNPKTIVFFVIALPGCTTRAAGHLPVQAQMLAVGALFPLIALLLDSVWAAAAGTVREWFTRSPRRLAMIGLGVGIAVTGRTDLCVLHRRHVVQMRVELLGNGGCLVHVLLRRRVGQHGLERLSGLPLRVVNDPYSVRADVDVRRDEAGQVLHDLVGSPDEDIGQLALALGSHGEHVDQRGHRSIGRDIGAGHGFPPLSRPDGSQLPSRDRS